MKLTTTFIVLMIATVGYSQNSKVKYGPKAKNERTWIVKSENTVSNNQEIDRSTGAIAKNNQTWLKNGSSLKSNSEEKITGPNAKNQLAYKSVKSLKTKTIAENDMVQTTDKN